jgi:integrase
MTDKGTVNRRQKPDSLRVRMDHYQQVAVQGVRSQAVARKIALHLGRFRQHIQNTYGHDRISTCVKRDVLVWQQHLQGQGLAPATVNNHLASLSAFASWVQAQDPAAFPNGDPTKGIGELPLPPLEPRTLSEEQVRTLKNLCDRLDRYYRLKGRKWAKKLPEGELPPLRAKARPWRDKAIVFVLLSTGLRRGELVQLNLDQLVPNTPERLRKARRAKLKRVRDKGKSERVVFLSTDARQALADYLETEHPQDVNETLPPGEQPLFVSAANARPRTDDGRLSPRSINNILLQIGRWHDAELDERDRERAISPLRPHDLRHTFAFRLAKATGSDAYELERRLGHRSQRYIQRYTNPPEEVAAAYVEAF